ncbi:MAG: hypothetical protein N4J56_004526 [Chroococcidiopsis sp. SAG 2025]|uniref:hypothetical protein n=1 Tax=Chroococcidiopsis sp. SAG 2025 TaxID=171389 RepID=UPI00293718AF|nr:hypothetical protein [Chroococcidiopsis sp. SAG 2025]MDV2994872.1 hypothetical protein [Chroococcidiopsis sp. SAG 2025]
MPIARLNKKQRAWVEKFKQQHPDPRIREIYEGLSGDRIVTLEWSESLPKIFLPGCTNAGIGWISHTLRVKLRKFGDLRSEPEYFYQITHTYCNIEDKFASSFLGQTHLNLHQLLNIRPPQNPVKFKLKKRSNVQPRQRRLTQLRLPLFGVAAQLHQIQLAKNSQVMSQEELLLETVAHRDLSTSQEIQLPAALVEILKNKKASLKEWENAIGLYQVAGASGLLAYLEGLDSFRQHFGTDRTINPKEQILPYQIESVKAVEQS